MSIARSDCEHGCEQDKFTISVLGVPCPFLSFDMCKHCLETYLNETSTLCADCHKPIFPGMSVAAGWVGAPHPYTHNTYECAAPGMWCGTWGEGRLIPVEDTHDIIDHGQAILITPKERG